MCLSLISLIYADEPLKNDQTAITSSPYQTVFLCVIMQLAAFLCVICAICGRITRKSTQSIAQRNPNVSLADFADHADKDSLGK